MGTMSWTDDRLDNFAAQTERRFDRLEATMKDGFAEVRKEVDTRFDKVDARFEKIDERFEKIDERFEGIHIMMHRTMVQLGFVMSGTLALGFLSIIVSQLLR